MSAEALRLPALVPVRSSVVKAIGYVRLIDDVRDELLLWDDYVTNKVLTLPQAERAPGFILIRLHSQPDIVRAYLAPAWVYALMRRRGTSKGRIYSRHLRGRPSVKVAA